MSDIEIFDWRNELKRWINKHLDVSSTIAENIPILFENAFEHARCPDRAWFGVHSTTVSLVIGGIYLVAIQRSGQDQGLWLLVDQNPPKIEALDYQPVKSTQKSKYPLVWGHSVSLNVIPELVKNTLLWQSFASASEKILFASIAGDRNQVQLKRNKKRLDSFWDNSSIELVDKQFHEAVMSALRDSSEVRKKRLEKAPVYPKRISTSSYVFERNPDVVATRHGDNKVIYWAMNDKIWKSVIKVTAAKDEVFLLSLHQTNPKEVRSEVPKSDWKKLGVA